MVPAVFMTYVITSFMFIGDQFFGIEDRVVAYSLAGAATLVIVMMVMRLILPYVTRKKELMMD